MTRNLIIAALFCGLITSIGLSDERKYVWTYEYQTLIPGEAEIEHYLTISTPDFDVFTGNTTVEHQVEYEFGMSERWDVGIYQSFKQTPGDALKYTGFKIRTRYRFGEKDKYIVDPLFYVEYISKPDFSEQAFEVKAILAKDFGKLNISVNPYFEYEFSGEESELVLKYAGGISYELHKLLTIGMEVKGADSGHYLGPTISHGSADFWVAVGTLFSIGDVDPGKPEFQARSIVAIRF